jgi:hypothetical protein
MIVLENGVGSKFTKQYKYQPNNQSNTYRTMPGTMSVSVLNGSLTDGTQLSSAKKFNQLHFSKVQQHLLSF